MIHLQRYLIPVKEMRTMHPVYGSVFMGVALVLQVLSLPAPANGCMGAFSPQTNSRGMNRLSGTLGKPLFKLQVLPETRENGRDYIDYKVQLLLQDRSFSEAKIVIESPGPCGSGHLTFDSQHFYEGKQTDPKCPRVLMTNVKSTMKELPTLLWTLPSCDCVKFRATVTESDGIYYTDNEEEEGPLSQTICIQKMATREERLESLCLVNDRYSTAEILSRPSFLNRHQLETRWIDKHGLEMSLELRRSDNRMCCGQSWTTEKLNCFENSRRRRVDRFCGDGYPDMPFTNFRVSHMRKKEKECCFILGEYRYVCFAEGSQLTNSTATSHLDFSQDETDPVNDLAEFASFQDKDILQRLVSVVFLNKSDAHDEHTSDEVEQDDKVNEEKEDKYTTENGRHNPTTPRRGSHKKSDTKPAESQLSFDKTREEKLLSKTTKKAQHWAPDQAGEDRKSRLLSRRVASRERLSSGVAGTWPVGEGTGESGERVPVPRLTSSERKALAKSSAQKREVGHEAVDEQNVEDQGGASVQETLHKLHKKVERLRMKSQCCAAGATAGRGVYGGTTNAKEECVHNASKYIATVHLASGKKKCVEQFRNCCFEQAVSGPSMTSGEFQSRYQYSVDTVEPPGQFSPHDDHSEDVQEGLVREGIDRDVPQLRETAEVYEMVSEKTFQSMRPVDNAEKLDDYDGPRRFDETDNEQKTIFDALERTAEKTSLRRRGYNQDFGDLDDRTFVGNDIEDEDDTFGRTDFGGSREKSYPTSTEDRRKKSYPASTEDRKKKSFPASTGDRKKKSFPASTEDRKKKEELGPWRPGKKSATLDLERGGQVSQSLDTLTLQEKALLASLSAEKSRLARKNRERGRSKSGKSRESKRQRKVSRERLQTSSSGHSYTGQHQPLARLGTVDSQEMAAAHFKSPAKTLDSKEMTEAYKNKEANGRGFMSDMSKRRTHIRPRIA